MICFCVKKNGASILKHHFLYFLGTNEFIFGI
jgi:hypothetical protein